MRANPGLPLLAVLLALSSGVASAADDEITLQPDQQTLLGLTVYQTDGALVQDRREAKLREGLNRIAFAGVSSQLRPDTVLVDGLDGEQPRLVEQRFDADLLSPRALLLASVGHDVRIAIRNPQTGEDRIETATVLAAAQGIVLKIGDRIETMLPGRIIYDSVPANLHVQPRLNLTLTSLKDGEAPIELSYLTGGIAWSANYVAKLNAAEDKLELSGRASVSNTSGSDYRNAHVTLVAGALNRIPEEPPRPQPRMMGMAMAAAAPAPAVPAPAPLGDYYRFALDRQISVGDHETVQFALLQAPAVPAKKEYWLSGTPPVTAASGSGSVPMKVEVRLNFENKKSAGLGMPMPSGVIRVYQRNQDQGLALLGEDRIDEVAADKPVKLTLGQAFDVTAERRQTSFAHPSDKSFEAGEEIVLHNAREKPVTVTVVENLPGDWTITQQSDPHQKASASEARWNVEVPAKGTHTLSYRVLTRF